MDALTFLESSLGFLGSWVLGFLGYWFLGSLVPWFLGSLVPWFLGSLVSGLLFVLFVCLCGCVFGVAAQVFLHFTLCTFLAQRSRCQKKFEHIVAGSQHVIDVMAKHTVQVLSESHSTSPRGTALSPLALPSLVFPGHTRTTHSCDRARITFKHVELASGTQRDASDFSPMKIPIPACE